MRINHKVVALLLFSNLLSGQSNEVWVSVSQPQLLREFWGVNSFTQEFAKMGKNEEIKFAIISRGFEGLSSHSSQSSTARRLLPKNTELVWERNGNEEGGSDFLIKPVNFSKDRRLGRHLAQLVWAMTGFAESGVQFRLYDGSTASGIDSAIADLKVWRPDVVLCTENFEGYGNFDGKGPLNKLVTDHERATKAIWIQSAGNYRYKTYEGPVDIANANGDVKFGEESVLKFWVTSEKTDVKVSLSWNANRRDVTGFAKDLNLYIYSPSKERLKPAGEIIQVVEPSEDPQKSVFPYEEVFLKNLPASKEPYLIAVKSAGGKFEKETDVFRLSVETNKEPSYRGDGQYFFPLVLEKSKGSHVMVPSDNEEVFTIADNSVDATSRVPDNWTKKSKPDLVLDSVAVTFTDGNTLRPGSHAAAASLAGVVLALKAANPNFGREHFRKLIERVSKENGVAYRSEVFVGVPPEWNMKSAYSGWRTDYEFSPVQIENRLAQVGLLSLIEKHRVTPDAVLKNNLSDVPWFLLRKHFAEYDFFKNLPITVQRKPETYDVYVCVVRQGREHRLQWFSVDLSSVSSSVGGENQLPWVKHAGWITQENCARFLPFENAMESRDYRKGGKANFWTTPSKAELNALVAP